MNVRAKFKVESVTQYTWGDVIKMNAIEYDGTDENASFSKFTPSGTFEMSVTNENIVGNYKAGQEYYLDFTPVPAPTED